MRSGERKGERLGAVLRRWRIEKSLTLQEVSARSAEHGSPVDWSQLSKMERGLAEPRLDVYERVALALGQSLEVLLAAAFPQKRGRRSPRAAQNA